MRGLARFFRLVIVGSVVLISSCTAVLSTGPRASKLDPGRPETIFGVLIGGRELDDDVAWDEIEKPFMIGIEGGWLGNPVGLELGVSYGADSTSVMGVDVDNTFLETSIGARAVFGDGPVFPYVGIGGALVLAEVEGESGGTSVSDDDVGFGFYGHGGVLFRIARAFYLGLDVRLLTGTDLEIFGIDTDADYLQGAVVIGWGG